MFDHVRDHLHRAARTAEDALTTAQATVDSAARALDAARSAAGAAQNGVIQATAAVNAAQASLAAAQREQARRAQDLSAAQAAVTNWRDSEPDRFGERGKPNPEWLAWRKRGEPLKTALTAAQKATDDATAAVAAAKAARDAALANLTIAQKHLTDAQTQVTLQQQRLAGAQSGVATARTGVQAAADRLAELDARQARFLADPPNPTDLLGLADEELAVAQALRHDLQQLRARRVALHNQRAALLGAHDSTMDSADVLATAMSAWSDTAYPEPGQAAGVLQLLVSASQSARTLPPGRRTDDLAGTAAGVQGALDALRAALSRANGVRDTAATRLQKAVDEVNTVADLAP